MRFRLIVVAVCLVIVALASLTRVHARDVSSVKGTYSKVATMDLSAFPDTAPDRPLNLLFIHHSVGGQWLADPGPYSGKNSIHVTHPNGGGLRKHLQDEHYVVHEASYTSQVGDHTDTFDWLPKFKNQMDQILTLDLQDKPLPPGQTNQIVMFKSCYPNVMFTGLGEAPGNPNGPDLTLANAQATYQALLPEFQKHPEVLFVCVTTPPLTGQLEPEPLWKAAARKILGKSDRETALLKKSAIARTFANWLKANDGWLKDYPLKNVVVFDYFEILTGGDSADASDLLKYPSGDDSHPNAAGQAIATQAFIPFLNRAVHRAGLDITPAAPAAH